MDLDQLRYFLRVAKRQSFTRAAEDLGISQPALSRSIQKLEEELLLMLPPDHPLVEKKTIRLSDVEPYPFVLLDEAHCLFDNIVSFCRERSFQPVAVERTSQLAMVRELVSLAHGVSMIPQMARRCDQSDRRVYRFFSRKRPTRTIVVVWNPYRFQSRLLEAFRKSLRNAPSLRHVWMNASTRNG